MAEQKQFTLTRQGLQEREEELEYLKTTKRKELADKIKEARGFGDLSENFEYDEAKNEQAKYEARIAELENILKNAVVIDEDDVDKDIVSLGSKVTILDVEFDEELKYTIVGSKESDPDKNKLSDESPIGHGLMGHKVNDIVTVEVPAGEVQFKILAIER